MIEKLKDYAELLSKGEALTDEQKKDIEAIGIQYGFPVPKKRCKNCYFDVVTQVLATLSGENKPIVTEKSPNEPNAGAKYVLRAGVDVLFNGERVNAFTLTDEKAERLIAKGFDTKFFAKLPK